jgi:hypothetical protein
MTVRMNSANFEPAGHQARSVGGRFSPARTCGALSLLLLAFGCESRPATTEPSPHPTEVAAEPAPLAPAPSATQAKAEWIRVGAPVPGGPAVGLSAVLASPSSFEGKRVVVEGQVRRTCTKKGCWMELAEGPQPTAGGCRVTFQDYGFFVPTDSSGSHARLEGQVEVKTLRKGHVDHLEAEGARFSHKNADGSALEVQIVASGVELKRG